MGRLSVLVKAIAGALGGCLLVVAGFLPAQVSANEQPPRCDREWLREMKLPVRAHLTNGPILGAKPIVVTAGRGGNIFWRPNGQRRKRDLRLEALPFTAELRQGKKVISRAVGLKKRLQLPRRPGTYITTAVWAESKSTPKPMPPEPVEPPYDPYDPDEWAEYWRLVDEYEEAQLFGTGYTDGPPCIRRESAKVRVTRGKLPRVKVSSYYGLALHFRIRSGRRCERVRTGPIILTVSGAASRHKVRLDDACGKWSKASRRGRWKLEGLSFNPGKSGDRTASFSYEGHQKQSHRFTWKTTMNGRVLGKGSFRNLVPRRIWWQEDDYVNICINDGLTIRSSGGNLYCDYLPNRFAIK